MMLSVFLFCTICITFFSGCLFRSLLIVYKVVQEVFVYFVSKSCIRYEFLKYFLPVCGLYFDFLNEFFQNRHLYFYKVQNIFLLWTDSLI